MTKTVIIGLWGCDTLDARWRLWSQTYLTVSYFILLNFVNLCLLFLWFVVSIISRTTSTNSAGAPYVLAYLHSAPILFFNLVHFKVAKTETCFMAGCGQNRELIGQGRKKKANRQS